MKARLFRIGKLLLYPAFYIFALAFFGYLTFPLDRLKDRVLAEFDAAQRKNAAPGSTPLRLEIDKLGSYWFTGAEVKGLRIIVPASKDAAARDAFGGGSASEPAADTVVAIDEAHVRVRMLPLLIGRVRADFWASIFGGEVSGSVPVSSSGAVDLALENVDLAKADPIVKGLGVPVRGVVGGKLELSPVEGKFNKATGTLDLKIANLGVGDGKTKIQGLLAIPEAKLGDLEISADAKDGVLRITKFASSPGHDVELVGDGKIAVREPWTESTADLYVRFKFSDAYRGKNDTTKALLGAPGSSAPALFDMDARVKRAKRADGFYGWHVYGPLSKLKFDPYSQDAPGASKPRKGIATPTSPTTTVNSIALPLGPSLANRPERASPSPLSPSPPPPPMDDPALRPPPPPPTPPPAIPAGTFLPPGMPGIGMLPSSAGSQPPSAAGGEEPPTGAAPAPDQPAEGTAPPPSDPTTE